MTTSIASPKKASALHEILQWSTTRPEWQRDALRRIIEKGTLDVTDILELERISRGKIQIAAIKPIHMAAQPLTVAHLPSSPGASESVSLISMGDLHYVNRLPSGATLPFGLGSGLTIIYGENGAGKSSYARVIKKACRARGAAQDITPDVFATKPALTPASATIAFKIGPTEVHSSWTNGVSADPRLANVFVFDASSADHYVSLDSEAAFTPYGLDVLPKLSKLCDELATRLKKDIDEWNTKITGTSANWKYDPTTQVGKLIQGLSKATKEAEVSALATLSQTEQQRLTNLREALKADPLQKAKQTKAAIARVESVVQRVKAAATALADTAIEEIRKQILDATTAAAAAKAFAAGQFDATYLTGTGSNLWRKLWEAARQYSTTEAYQSDEYPATSEAARCVLCQQDLAEDARLRFSRFDAFCKDKSQQLSADVERVLLAISTRFNLNSALKPDIDKIEADIAVLTPMQIAQLSDFVSQADLRLQQVKLRLEEKEWTAPTDIPASPETILQAAVSTLEERAKTEEAANDPIARKALEVERKELEAREWLFGVKADVLKQIDQYKIVAELEQCKKDLNTSAITTRSGELTEMFVTKAFQDRFKDETKALSLTTLSVVMKEIQGKKGITLFGLRLENAANNKLAEIASEGEQRCVALAAFLSELSQASHQSALVFDDPVSSLDHRHREKIAERLADEASKRQVIVFTHDEIFANDLWSFANNASMEPYVLTVEWDNNAPGKCTDGLPWDKRQQPLNLLQELDKEQSTLAAHWNNQPNQTNVADMRQAYSRLRSALERIIEIELLSDVVRRFRSHVKSGDVYKLEGITSQEIAELKRLLQKCHDLTSAHAPSTVAIPSPANLTQDISDARQLVTTIRNRKKILGSAGKP
jgi:energy-coupling factor transporter ATP-binding protein EcfA2